MPTTPPGASDLSAAWELVVRRFPLAKRLDYSVPLKTQMVLKAKNVFSAGRIEFDAGATDFLAKPFSISQLRARATICAMRGAEAVRAAS